jgi:hypothetical protein
VSDSTVNLEDRDGALAAFAEARTGFEDAYRPIPDDALRYVPQGEDYTLGGLVAHVTDVIAHYTHVLGEMVGAEYREVRVVDPDGGRARMDALIRDGYSGAERAQVFAEMGAAHDAFAARVRTLPGAAYTRSAPVLYGADAVEPYETRPADIVGWLIDHYREHITQATALLATWRSQGR